MTEPVPEEVQIEKPARGPVQDPTLGVGVAMPEEAPAKHRLVVIGDSLSHGFQSGAIFRTGESWPAIVAREMGLGPDEFRAPVYGGPGDGLPINLEALLRRLERDGGSIDPVKAPFQAREFMAQVEEYWERGEGATPRAAPGAYHNLGMYGWDLRDALHWTSENLMIRPPKNNLLRQLPQDHKHRAAQHVLASAPGRTQVGAARSLGEDGGIETLVVELGANNVLGAVLRLKVVWSGPDFADPVRKKKYTVWRPSHFVTELAELAGEIRKIRTRYVVWATVPHVTIAPLARGVGEKLASLHHRYFPHYTRVWIPDEDFQPHRDPNFTGAEALAVDAAIDRYNDAIETMVRRAREEGRPWYLFDLAGLLDRLAHKRYFTGTVNPPERWTPYPLPPELEALNPNTLFFQSGESGRTHGGLFSLDGIHPTTIGYGLIAQEVLNVMHRAGVTLPSGTPRVDFSRLAAADTLIQSPPKSLGGSLKILRVLDETLDIVNGALASGFGESLLGKDADFGL
jgi:lysophospholipase L1-like esterase